MNGVKICASTHGAAGYAEGSFWDGYDIVCGECGHVIHDPEPTSACMKWVPDKGFFGVLHLKGHYEFVYKWPDWIGGKRGKRMR